MSGRPTQSIEAKARALGLSADALMELAFDVLESSADEEATELRALIDQVNRTVPQTLKIVDDCHRRVNDILNGVGADRRATSSERAIGARPSPVPHEVDVHIGSRVRLRRKMLGLTEQQVADIIGVRRQQLQQFERGVRRIGAARLAALSRILDVPVYYFFDSPDSDPPAPNELKSARKFARILSELDQQAASELVHLTAAE